MLRINQKKDAASAKDYFKHELSQGDYYSEGQEVVGMWGGEAAKLLGLSGQVSQQDFDNLVDNIHPDSGEQITAHQRSNRTAGYDFTFNAPKSLSVLYEHSKDDNLLAAFRDSVSDTMQEIEQNMAARVRKDGADYNRETGNLAYAEFIHHTARPVDGIPDPHLHAHCFVMNATFDSEEQQWKAGQFRDLKAESPYYEAAFHARLSQRIHDLGYGIDTKGKFWDITGIDQDILDKYSHRTAQIDQVAQDNNITNAKTKSELAATTRENKTHGLTRDDLSEIWDARLTNEERFSLNHLIDSGEGSDEIRITPDKAVDFAINHRLERQSVTKLSHIKEEALRAGYGAINPGDVNQAVEARSDLIHRKVDGKDSVTTRKVLNEEQHIIDFTKDGYSKCTRLNPDWQIKADFLSTEQQDAVQHILTSRDRVVAIQGKAGVGKTTLMKEAIDAIEQSNDGTASVATSGATSGGATRGTKVFTFAPSADASRGVLREEGFANADTVAKLLNDQEMQSQVKDSVIWIDEAGLLSSKDMGDIFDIAKAQNARVILSGDIKQHSSVKRGDAFAILQQHANLQPANIDTIRRQQGEYREAVTAISEGKVEQGFNIFDRLGKIQEIEDENDRYKTLADDYITVIDKGKSALIVSPTHKEADKVTSEVRSQLQQAGKLKGEAQQFVTYKNLQLTEAQKTDTRFYEVGQSVKFNQKATGIQRGERLQVIAVDQQKNTVLLENSQREKRQLPLEHSKRFNIYSAKNIELQKGDKIRITENGSSLDKHRLSNGRLYDIKEFDTHGNIKLSNGWLLGKETGNITHGYVTTSHASQGKTVDEVFIAQSVDSFPASGAEQFYVSASRGKQDIHIYTDDKGELLKHVGESSKRMSATQMLADNPESEQKLTNHQRLLDLYSRFEPIRQYMKEVKDKAQQYLYDHHPGQNHNQHDRTEKWVDRVKSRTRADDLEPEIDI